MKDEILGSCVCLIFLLAFAGVIYGIVVAIEAIVHYKPQKVAIKNANLTRFELSTNPTTSLFYNLSFTMSIHGEEGKYHDMEVDCYYCSEQFDSVKLEEFSIKGTSTRLFNFFRSGISTINMNDSGVVAFRRSNETGFFDVEIWLKGKWFRQIDVNCNEYGSCEHRDYDSNFAFQCKLRLQLITPQNNSTPSKFQVVKCH